MTTVSNQGRMRGRAKGLMRIKDLSKGQKLGFGKNRMVFPGLTTAIKAKEPGSTKVEEMSKESYEQYLDQRFVPSTHRKNSCYSFSTTIDCRFLVYVFWSKQLLHFKAKIDSFRIFMLTLIGMSYESKKNSHV